MARLYLSHSNDKDSKDSHCGNEMIRAAIYWGSRDNSYLAGEMWVVWSKCKDEPEVHYRDHNGEFILEPVIRKEEMKISRWKQK